MGEKKIKNPYVAIVYLELLLLYRPEVQVEALRKLNKILASSIRSQHAMYITGK